MKKLGKSLIFLVITLLLIIYALKDVWRDSLKILSTSNLLWIFLALAAYFIYFFIETICLYKLVQQYKENYSFKECLKLSIMSRFFNAVTPFSSGGQPLQVYELKKDGISVIHGTAIMTESFILFQSAVVIWAIIAITFNSITKVVITDGFIGTLATIGFVINIALLIAVLLMCMSKNFNRKVISLIIKLLAKLKIVKDKKVTIEKWDERCNEYYLSFRGLLKNKKLAIYLIILEIIALLLYFMTAYFSFKALNIDMAVSLTSSIIISAFIFFVGTFIPIPGGSGGVEYAFITLFAYYFDKSYVLSALIIWRLVYYYLPMVVGGIFFYIKRVKEK